MGLHINTLKCIHLSCVRGGGVLLAACFYGITGPRRGKLMGLHIHAPLHELLLVKYFLYWLDQLLQKHHNFLLLKYFLILLIFENAQAKCQYASCLFGRPWLFFITDSELRYEKDVS